MTGNDTTNNAKITERTEPPAGIGNEVAERVTVFFGSTEQPA